MLNSVSPGWCRGQRHLHWWTAVCVVVTFALGFWMIRLPTTELLLKFLSYQLHKSLGITVIILASVRLAVRARKGRPAWPGDMPAIQRRLASAVHVALYGLLLLVPILGYLTAASAPANVPTLFFGIPVPHIIDPNAELFATIHVVHKAAAMLLITLSAVHAVAALHRYIVARTGFARTP